MQMRLMRSRSFVTACSVTAPFQFKERLKWDVTVSEEGFETDEYDEMNPLYMIYEMPDGSHGGSMRNLPTTGDTMIISPPLVITTQEIDLLVERAELALDKTYADLKAKGIV